MRKELKTIEISNIPELVRIAEKVRRTGEPRVLRSKRENLAILKPVRSPKKTFSHGKPFTKKDALWNFVGIGRSGLTDVSENKYKYLADAYAPKT